jgi:oligopeptide transport system substrate-binding protein
MDPQQMGGYEGALGQLVFEGLLALNEQQQVVPAAAEKFEVSADGLQYTLTLRDGLKYSDGTPLTAPHFAYAWRRLLDPRTPFRHSQTMAYIIAGAAELDSTPPTDTLHFQQRLDQLGVTAPDDRHIIFTLKHPAAYFPYILTLGLGWPSRQDLVEQGGDAWATDRRGRYLIGNGPFVVTEYNPPEMMRLVPNPYYRKGPPRLQELQIRFIAETAVAFQAYRQGQLDVLDVAPGDYATVRADAHLQQELVQFPGATCNFLNFNSSKPPFDKPQVRQAFAQALDREDFVQSVLAGLGHPAPSIIPPGRPGYAPDLDPWPFDEAAARRTLAAAGYPDGAGLPPVQLTYISDDPRARTRAEWVQNQLQQHLHVTITLDPMLLAAAVPLFGALDTTPQFYPIPFGQDYPDPQDWLSTPYNSATAQIQLGWHSTEFDRLTNEADVTVEATRREMLYHQAHALLLQEAPVIPLYWDDVAVLVKPYVQNLREHLSLRDYTTVEIAPH